MIFGFSTSSGLSERFSLGGSGAAAGAASSFLALAGFFAGLVGASTAAAAGASDVGAAGASGAAAASTFVSSVSAFALGAFVFAGFFSSESAMTKNSNR